VVDHALQDSGSLLYAARIFKSETDHAANNKYTLLRGAAIMRLEDYVRDNKVAMPEEKQREMIKDLMSNSVTQYGLWNSHAYKYEMEGLPPVTITTKEERDKLPIGQHYMYKGERGIKRDDTLPGKGDRL
jgi:hypothetical protein